MHLNKILIRLSNRYDTHQLCPIAIIPRSNLHILWDIIVKFQKNGEVSTCFSVREMADMLLITCRGYIPFWLQDFAAITSNIGMGRLQLFAAVPSLYKKADFCMRFKSLNAEICVCYST